MNPSLTVALDVTTIMAAVMVVVTPLKGILEAFVPPTHRLHDALVQVLALLVGVLFGLIAVWAEGPLTRSAEVELIIGLLLGIGGGSAAIGAQHVIKTSTRHPVEPPVPDQAPVRTVPPVASTSVPYAEVSSDEPIRPQDA